MEDAGIVGGGLCGAFSFFYLLPGDTRADMFFQILAVCATAAIWECTVMRKSPGVAI